MDLPVEQPLANRRETVAMNLVSVLKTDPFSVKLVQQLKIEELATRQT